MFNKSVFSGVVISKEVDLIARALIKDFKITNLQQLTFMLGVNPCFTDHQALRLWLQQKVDDGTFSLAEAYGQARIHLSQLFDCQ